MARKSKYYKQLNDDMHDLYAERNILRAERDNLKKSIVATRRKCQKAYADIERREAELREKEKMPANERMQMKYNGMKDRYMGMKNELKRYRLTIERIEESGEYPEVVELFKEVGWISRAERGTTCN